MKTRLLIIIGIVVALGSLTTILAMNFLDDEKTTVSDTSPKQLEAIMEYCIDSKVLVDTVGLSYYNDTHFIDTITCEWQKHDRVEIDSEGLDSNPLQMVLDYCNDTSGFKNAIHLYYVNETHSIENNDCKWKKHQNFPSPSSGMCIPYVEKWVFGEDWNNGTHYFDTDSCKWRDNPEYDELNSKGCPQFCPKEENQPDQLRGIFGNCACQERTKSNSDTMERCIQPDLSWENSTHYIDNSICEWQEK